MKFAASVLALAALVSGAAAQLTIISPGGPNLWWVAQSQNVIVWSCKTSPYENFTISIANSNPDILVEPLAFVAQQPNYDCSEAISQYQVTMPAADGYTILLSNSLNATDVYATSQPFEIKALGATYPAASATPTSGTTNSTSTSTSGAAATSTTTKSGSERVVASLGGLAAVVAALGFSLA
ncbi:uncharacterized protein FIBRA_02481 [Fibroporia radiculosa]|uniref:Phytocyanin domain-containing protein n=1 Tax=Fibroporia radiculosa TaxID=599839 RepID=J4H1V8_9APHY|nr:uncharacterized protein FIBRA_02481 [Fibroporia radiculosa]CCM00449.1 predicted protein [Fibroporia radiculosa]